MSEELENTATLEIDPEVNTPEPNPIDELQKPISKPKEVEVRVLPTGKIAIKTSGIVEIKSVVNLATGKQKMLRDANSSVTILKNRDGSWKVPFTPEEFFENFKQLSIRMIKTVNDRKVWNDEEVKKLRISLPHNGLHLNLEDELDRFKYYVLSQKDAAGEYVYAMIGDSEKPTSTYSCFYIINKEKEASETIGRAQKIKEAYDKLFALTQSQIFSYAALYGYATKDTSFEVAQAKVAEEIQKNPSQFLLYEHNTKDTEIKSNFKLGLEYMVFSSKEGMYYYGEQLIGTTDKEVCDFFSKPDNAQLYNHICSVINKARKAD